MANILPFRDPSLPLTGAKRLVARRLFRASCKAIAAKTVAQALNESFKTPGCGELGTDDAFPVFVAATRRELRKWGMF